MFDIRVTVGQCLSLMLFLLISPSTSEPDAPTCISQCMAFHYKLDPSTPELLYYPGCRDLCNVLDNEWFVEQDPMTEIDERKIKHIMCILDCRERYYDIGKLVSIADCSKECDGRGESWRNKIGSDDDDDVGGTRTGETKQPRVPVVQAGAVGGPPVVHKAELAC